MQEEEKIIEEIDKKNKKIQAFQGEQKRKQKIIIRQIMVLIRVRPPLENEYGKEIVASIADDVCLFANSF